MRWRRRLFLHEKTFESSAWSSVPRIRILLSAFRERALCNLTDAGVSNAMSRESSRSLESNQAPFRITSPWLVTRQTASRGCQDGVRSLLGLFCRVLADWKRSHPTHGIGR